MPDTAAAVVDLRIAASRARDLHDEVVAAIDRAHVLSQETSWQAAAAATFREAVRSWCAELVAVRGDLWSLETEAADAAARLQHRPDAVGAVL